MATILPEGYTDGGYTDDQGNFHNGVYDEHGTWHHGWYDDSYQWHDGNKPAAAPASQSRALPASNEPAGGGEADPLTKKSKHTRKRPARIRYAVIVFAIASVVCNLIALFTTSWWHLDVAFPGLGSSQTNLGIFRSCSGDGRCSWNTWSGTDWGTCRVEAAAEKGHFLAIALGALIAAALAIASSWLSLPARAAPAVLRIKFMFVCTAVLCIACGVFYWSMTYWWFCHLEYCDWLLSTHTAFTTCNTQFGRSYGLFVASAVLSFVAFLFAVIAYCLRPKKREGLKAPKLASPATAAATDGDAAGEVAAASPGGDWEWDPNTEMWWSDAENLFYHADTGHYYDPNSGWWCDENGEWYDPEAYGEHGAAAAE